MSRKNNWDNKEISSVICEIKRFFCINLRMWIGWFYICDVIHIEISSTIKIDIVPLSQRWTNNVPKQGL